MDEETVKPCIQDRFMKFIRSSFSWNKILIFLLMTCIIYLSFFLGVINLFNRDALRLLVEIEAIILGFYGLIYTNIINSMNSTVDRQLILRAMTSEPPSSIYPHEIMEKSIKKIEEVRKNFTTMFFLIVLSMTLGIASIAMYDVELLGKLLFYFNIIGSYFFFHSFYLFMKLIGR